MHRYIRFVIAAVITVLLLGCTSASSAHTYNLQRALNATPYGGTLSMPPGTYTITTPLLVPAGITVKGNGAVLKTPACTTTSASNDEIMKLSSGDTITGVVFDGNEGNQCGQWSQHRHAVVIASASGDTVISNTFRNLIGDGVYATSVTGLSVKYNTFDGTHANRNGVSIISAYNVSVFGNTFNSMSRPDMPGAVDLEPNTSGESMSDIRITGNIVNDPAKAGLLIWDSAAAPVSDVTFRGNIVNCGASQVAGGAGILSAYAPDAVAGNTISECYKFNGLEWDWASSGSGTDNTVNGAANGAALWYSRNIVLSGNTWLNISDHDVWSGP